MLRSHCGPLLFAVLLAISGAASAQAVATSGTTPIVIDGNRVYARLSFVRPDGSTHTALAFVDMGSPTTIVDAPLFEELQLADGQPLVFRVGHMSVRVPASAVTRDPRGPRALGKNLQVEAVLPAGVLERYITVIDYARRTLILAGPGIVKPRGIAVPFRINEKTGLLAVDASIDGTPYAITIDNGSAYTWLRQSTVAPWLAKHPEWERGVGAVGPSNMMMSGDGAEATGILVRIPEVRIGSLVLRDVRALGAGPGRGAIATQTLFDWYAAKNAVPVIGWIGGNVLEDFRLTVDYPNHTIYWLRQNARDNHDLDQVGLTLEARDSSFVVAAIATKNDKPTVAGVEIGDLLMQVDTLQLRHATWGAIFSALHGVPGDERTLTLERQGVPVVVKARVTAF